MTQWYGPGAVGSQGQWVTQPDGTMRFAPTSQQGSYNGQGTPSTSGHWQYGSDGSAIWVPDASTSQQGSYKGQGTPSTGGRWYDRGDGTMFWVPDGQPDPGQAPASGTGDHPTAPSPAPDPFAAWSAADPNTRSYRYFGTDLQQYYDQNPTQGYQQYLTAEYGDRQTPLEQYAEGRYSRDYADYIKASEGNDQMHWTDYLTSDHANQLRNSFALQSPGQKGYTDTFMPSGRSTF